MQQEQFKRELYTNIILPQDTRKISNNLTLHLKQEKEEHVEKEEQTNPKLVGGKTSLQSEQK